MFGCECVGWEGGCFAKFFSSGKPLWALCHWNTLEGRGGLWLFRGVGLGRDVEEIRSEKSPGAVTNLLRNTRVFTHGAAQYLFWVLPCQARVELAIVMHLHNTVLFKIRDVF
jgi:hypothetical protein